MFHVITPTLLTSISTCPPLMLPRDEELCYRSLTHLLSRQAWLQRKRLRDTRLKAAALRKLATEAELESRLSEDVSRVRPNIVINPRDSVEDCDRTVRPNIVTFQIPQSEPEKESKQKRER